MIGMSQIRKRLIYGILIGVAVGVIGIIITVVWALNVVKSYEDGTNEDYIKNYTTEVVMLNRDVIQGETIKDDMLMTARVHKSTSPADQAGYTAIGKIAKYNIPANIPLVNGMFGSEIVTVDERIQDVSVVNLPTDLSEGDYIDIKIKMPSGLEYVVIPQIKVRKVMGNTIRLYLNEEDLYYLNSATVDTYLNDGVVLYGVKYVDPTTQIKLFDEEDQMNLPIDFAEFEKNKEKASDLAKKELLERIENDIANGAVTLTVPEDVDSENVIEEETEPTLDENANEDVTETNNTETTQEYINFRDNLADLLLKYAVEYRYYVESYNKIARTYEPSDMIREHMMENEYITEKAKESLKKALEDGVRRSIEERISQFQSDSGEKFENAVSGLSNQITAQQAIRNSTLSGQ